MIIRDTVNAFFEFSRRGTLTMDEPFVDLIAEIAERLDNEVDGRFFDLLIEIAERLAHDWTVKEMEAKVGLSPTQFRSVFKTVTLLTPTAYLKETRLLRAKHLLETTYEHIDQIAIQVGLRDHSHFARDFKEKFGVTPTEYRRQYQKKRQDEILKRQGELEKKPDENPQRPETGDSAK